MRCADSGRFMLSVPSNRLIKCIQRSTLRGMTFKPRSHTCHSNQIKGLSPSFLIKLEVPRGIVLLCLTKILSMHDGCFLPPQLLCCDLPVSQYRQISSNNHSTEGTSSESHWGLDGMPSGGPVINNEMYNRFSNLICMSWLMLIPILQSPLVHNTAGDLSSC